MCDEKDKNKYMVNDDSEIQLQLFLGEAEEQKLLTQAYSNPNCFNTCLRAQENGMGVIYGTACNILTEKCVMWVQVMITYLKNHGRRLKKGCSV